MNSDEYHAPNHDDTHPNTCRFCGKAWDQHEHSCPKHADDNNTVYLELREPWTETP